MGTSARQIAEGDLWTPSDTNNLFKDIHDIEAGHQHDAFDSRKIAFRDLDVLGDAGETAPESGDYSYNDIAEHLDTTTGVHGLDETVFVLGAVAAAGYVVQFGQADLGTSTTVGFPQAFTGTPYVFVQAIALVGGSAEGVSYIVISRTTADFTVERSDNASANIIWLAIGPMEPPA